jgi:hypothetical protein
VRARPEAAARSAVADLQALWESRHGDAFLPPWSAIDVFDLRPWLGHLILLEVIDGGADFRYRVHGTALVALRGEDLTGRHLSTLPRGRDRLLQEYRGCIAAARPTVLRRRYLGGGRDYITVVKGILPFAEDGRTVDRLLVAMYEIVTED